MGFCLRKEYIHRFGEDDSSSESSYEEAFRIIEENMQDIFYAPLSASGYY